MSVEPFALEYLSCQQIRILLQQALGASGADSSAGAYKTLRTLTPCAVDRYYNTVGLFTHIGLLQESANGRLTCDPRLPHLGNEDLHNQIGIALRDGLENTDVLAHLSDCAQFSVSAGVVIDFRAIPWRYRNLRTLLVEIGYFVRESINDQHWAIASYAQDQFLRFIGAKNAASLTRTTVTPAQLDEALAARAEGGAIAEKWMYERERKRLRDHPLSGQITLVSELDVAAGYDIASFNSIGSLNLDRFLEVKSFTGLPRFYWSANEVNTAERLGDKYALCLVDRARMSDPAYEPQLIFEPFRRLIRESSEHWSVETDVYFLRSIDRATA